MRQRLVPPVIFCRLLQQGDERRAALTSPSDVLLGA